MENLSLIAAIGKNNELGINNSLIWRIEEDLKFYKSMTIHENIIMGRKTLESMPAGALKNRTVFVLSSRALDKEYDVNCFSNVQSLLKYIEMTNQHFIVVGGAQIYETFMPYIDTMYLTEIDEYANADTFFPYIDIHDWCVKTIYRHDVTSYLDDDISYVRNMYVRRRKR